MRKGRGLAAGWCFVWLAIMAGTSLPAYSDEPIAFIGHGAMFDREGRQIEVTAAFIEQAQQFYLRALSASANEEQLARLRAQEARLLEGRSWDPQSKLIATSAVIEWLLDELDSPNLHDVHGKNKLIQQYLQRRLFPPAKGARFVPPIALTDVLGMGGGVVPLASSLPERQAYIAECLACGVPTPPDWGSPQWISEGTLANNETFISDNLPSVEVLKYTSTTPRGACIALPRATGTGTNDTINLLGIICLGQDTSKACFWDNQNGGINEPFPVGTPKPLTFFEGGPGLNGGSGGECTTCHAGENPFVIHPNSVLGTASEMGDDWYKPLVHPSWAQNEGPSNVLDGVSPQPGCLACHTRGGAGRFPTISAQLNGAYCMIVSKATATNSSNTFTMPPGNEGGYPNHTATLLAQCTVQRPIPAFTINGVNPKQCGFAYSFEVSPTHIVANGSISTTYGSTSYIWGYCQTQGLNLPCLSGSGVEFPFSQVTHDFGLLGPGTYRIHLRVLSGSFDEIKIVQVLIFETAPTRIPTLSSWGAVTLALLLAGSAVVLRSRSWSDRS